MRAENRVRSIRADRDDPIYQKVGVQLTQLRLEAGLTQTQIANQLGLNGSTITLYEKAQNRVPLGVFIRWCAALGQDPGSVLRTASASRLVPRQDGRRKGDDA
jgi:transcriptional regulator with XRE-family HTH domain